MAGDEAETLGADSVVVDSFAAPSWLLWRTPNRSGAWRLIPLAGERDPVDHPAEDRV